MTSLIYCTGASLLILCYSNIKILWLVFHGDSFLGRYILSQFMFTSLSEIFHSHLGEHERNVIKQPEMRCTNKISKDTNKISVGLA